MPVDDGHVSIEEEIASQPACWARVLERADALAAPLPEHGARALAIGCGTSLHMARAYARLREAAGSGETDWAPASEMPARRAYDVVVAISRSGTTTEIVRALEDVGSRARTVGIVTDAASPVGRLVDDVVVLDFADERAVVQTRFPTTVMCLLRRSLGEDLAELPDEGARALEAPLPRPDGDLDHVVFLGRGWTIGLADEAALKFGETARGRAESYPAMEYRHGPLSSAGPGTLVWSFGALPDGLERALTEEAGAQVELVRGDPLAGLVTVQRQAVATARARGLDPAFPRLLDRSVILP
jgi:fructoselysine-6-P-deglycase FrlB-like protein